MENVEFAAALRELAALLEFEEADAHRIAAYRRAAAAIEAWPEDADALARDGRLETVPGVGPVIARLLAELARTGRLGILDETRERLPRGVWQVIALPGVGPRRAARLLASLRVASLVDLDRALRQGRLGQVGVAGPDEEAIRTSLELVRLGVGALPLGLARPRARAIAERLAALPDVLRVMLAGEVRRGMPLVGEVVLAAAAGAPDALLAAFRSAPQVRMILAAPGEAGARVALDEGLVVALHVSLPTGFGGVLWRATGHDRHVAQVETLLARGRRGAGDVRAVSGEEERDLYEAARLPFIPPELREGRGEVEAARERRLPRLVEAGEVEGDLRVQSDWAGGAHAPERLAAAAAEAGHRWLAIVDPARTPRRPSGLDGERAARRAEALRAWNAMPGARCTLLAGVEAAIGEGGVLEGDLAALAGAEVRLAVAEAGGPLAARSRAERTAAVVRALLSREVDLLGLRPDPGSPRRADGALDAPAGPAAGDEPAAAWLDLGAVLAAAASAGAALVVAAHPGGSLLGPADLRRAAALGVPLALGTGARAAQELPAIDLGIVLARRAGLGPAALLNARGEAELRAWVAARRA